MSRTGRPREFNRDAAVKLAMNLFWQKGYESTSLAELRKTLGNLSAASFYSAFGSKYELYKECLDLYTHTCGETLSLLSDPIVPAKVAIKNMLVKTISLQTSMQTPTGCMAVLSGLNCCEENEEVEQLALSIRNGIRQALEDCIERGIKNNEWNISSTDTESFVIMIDTFLNGISIQSRDAFNRRKLMEACNLFLKTI